MHEVHVYDVKKWCRFLFINKVEGFLFSVFHKVLNVSEQPIESFGGQLVVHYVS